MQVCGGVEVQFHTSSARVEGELSGSRPSRLPPGKSPLYPLVEPSTELVSTQRCEEVVQTRLSNQ
jgi:hypothetical protein